MSYDAFTETRTYNSLLQLTQETATANFGAFKNMQYVYSGTQTTGSIPRTKPAGSSGRRPDSASPRAATEAGAYSGNGLPRVSGAKGRAARPTRKTRLMVTPA